MTLLSASCGKVIKLTNNHILVKDSKGTKVDYVLNKYRRSNQDTCINQKSLVWLNEKIFLGQVIADGASTEGGELAVGQNILIVHTLGRL